MILNWLRGNYPAPAAPNKKLSRRQPTRALRIEQLEDRLAMTIVAGGDGTQNTTAPTDDPGFANVGVCGGASAIYLGNGWVLTAVHVGAQQTRFNNILYDVVPNSSVQLTNPTGPFYTPNTDLLLFQINGRPDLPSISIGVAGPAIGWNVIMVGDGLDRAATETYWDTSWATTPSPSAYAGYYWSPSVHHVRWGTNTISGVSYINGVGVNDEAAFITTFTGNTSSDAMGASGDSGGAVFHKDGAGNWNLIGVMFAISGIGAQPQNAAVFGDKTYIADLSVYRTQILNVIGTNHAPVGASKTVTTPQNTAYTFGTADFGFSDPNDNPANAFMAVVISSLPVNGTLTENGTAVALGQVITVADISAGKLKFTPASNASGASYASFTFRVQDDGGTINGGINTDPSPKTMTVNVTPSITASLFSPGAMPATVDGGDGSAIELGVKFTANSSGYITGISYYKSAANSGVHTGSLWSATGQLLGTATFTSEGTSGWQQVTFATPVAVAAGTTYVASYHTNTGHYAVNRSYFAAPVTSGPLTVPASGGVFLYGAGGFPTQSYQASNYWVDVVFSSLLPLDTTPPTVTSITPAAGATGIATSAAVTITFSEALNAASVNASTVQLFNGSTPVAATVAYNPTNFTVTLTPVSALSNSTTYTVVVTGGASGVKDLAGNPLSSNFTSSFITAAAGSSTFSLWSPSTVPGSVDFGDASAIELGVRFSVNTNGYITGIRYYKSAANTGDHTGSLWSATGQLLATATFTSEGTSGWQQVLFATPVAVAAGTTYVASYHTTTGHYAANRSYFTAPYANGPISVPVNGGVYLYGAGGFPSQSYLSSNYWVDVSFSTTPPADTAPPTVIGSTPSNGATGVVTSAAVTIRFSEALNAASVNASTVQLFSGSTLVAATVSYNPTNFTVTFTPTSALGNSTTYTIVVTGGASGVKDLAGNPLASNFTSAFTTISSSATAVSLFSSSAIPQTADSGDGSAIEVGVKFTVNTNGYITGIRYYKSGANTGVHTGSLWSAAGQLLATATFTSEGASGWQQVTFTTPVAVTAGTTYVASYHTNTGHFAVDRSFFMNPYTSGPLTVAPNGGVFQYGAGGFPTQSYQASNYWVDVLFVASVG